ncbi:MAG: reverse transcriptase-like protein [Firmicutes bacterium]|nr:reverse transcriptase-like protein [Bacillota bacterium]
MSIFVYTDGLCQPVNPGGIATYGWVAYKDSKKIQEECACVCSGPEATNNVAEYSGIIAALRWLLANGYSGEKIIVCSDSQFCVRQLNGQYAVKSTRVMPLYLQVKELARKFKDLSFEWIHREKNQEADSLSRKAYDNYVLSTVQENIRRQKAKKLAVGVQNISKNRYRVESQSTPGLFYVVDLEKMSCACPDFATRGKLRPCKHILAVRMFVAGKVDRIAASR